MTEVPSGTGIPPHDSHFDKPLAGGERVGKGFDLWEKLTVKARQRDAENFQGLKRPRRDITPLSPIDISTKVEGDYEVVPEGSGAILIPNSSDDTGWDILFGRDFKTYSTPDHSPVPEKYKSWEPTLEFDSEEIPPDMRAAMELNDGLRAVAYGDKYVTYTHTEPLPDAHNVLVDGRMSLSPFIGDALYFPKNGKQHAPVHLESSQGGFLLDPQIFEPIFQEITQEEPLPMLPLPGEFVQLAFDAYKEQGAFKSKKGFLP